MTSRQLLICLCTTLGAAPSCSQEKGSATSGETAATATGSMGGSSGASSVTSGASGSGIGGTTSSGQTGSGADSGGTGGSSGGSSQATTSATGGAQGFGTGGTSADGGATGEVGGAAGEGGAGADGGAGGTNDEDCNGTPGGTATLDHCGVCDSDPSNDCVQDCAGEWGGTATVDDCGTCDDDPTNDCPPEHCSDAIRNEDEWGVDCGGEACVACVPCNESLPLNSTFSVDVNATIFTVAPSNDCGGVGARTNSTKVLQFGATLSELWIGGEQVVYFDYMTSTQSGSVLTLNYGAEEYGWTCFLIGHDFPHAKFGVIWSLSIRIDLETGQLSARESCQDAGGLCFINGEYEDGRATGTGANVCL